MMEKKERDSQRKTEKHRGKIYPKYTRPMIDSVNF